MRDSRTTRSKHTWQLHRWRRHGSSPQDGDVGAEHGNRHAEQVVAEVEVLPQVGPDRDDAAVILHRRQGSVRLGVRSRRCLLSFCRVWCVTTRTDIRQHGMPLNEGHIGLRDTAKWYGKEFLHYSRHCTATGKGGNGPA